MLESESLFVSVVGEVTLNFLNFDLKKVLSFLFIVSLPLISINMQQKPTSQGWYDKPFSFLGSVTQSAFFTFSDGVRGNTLLYLDLINIKKENLRLKSVNDELLTRLEVQAELEKENIRLNQLLEFKTHSKMELIFSTYHEQRLDERPQYHSN